MTKIYGIPNCDTVKKARRWLEENHVDVEFHDFKKQGTDAAQLRRWGDAVGLDRLLNRQGTTWRKLSDEDKARADNADGAIALLQANASLIKRPVLEHGDTVLVGFDAARYAQLLGH